MSIPNFAIRTILFDRRRLQTGWERVKRILRSEWLLAILAVAWLLWLSAPFLLLGPLGYVRSIELGDAVYPQVAYIVEMLREGKFSLWLPSQGSGTDLLGNFNAPYLNLALYVALPVWLANNVIFLVVTATATVSLYVLMRRSFDCSVWAAALGGALYSIWFLLSFDGLVFGYAAGLAFALAPLLLYWLLSIRDWSLRGLWPSLLLGLGFAIGGHYTWSVFVVGTVFFCALLLAPQRIRLWFPHLLIVCAVTGLLQLPVFIANVETASLSARTVETYYRSAHLWPLIYDYVSQNPGYHPFGKLVVFAIGLAVAAVFLSDKRWQAVREGRLVWSMSALFVLLPLIDIAVLYGLSVLSVGGFALEEGGGFGGPFDCRLRLARAFIASAAFAGSVDMVWKVAALHKRLNGIAGIDWDQRLVWARFVEPKTLISIVFAAGAVAVGALAAWHVFGDARDGIKKMRQMAVDGMSFAAIYHHPQLRALAAANPARDTYRVATVQLNGPDTGTGAPCCRPREGSLYGTFQNAYGFEIADAYMSNLTARSVNFWDVLITGHPGFPRAEFSSRYEKKFMYPERAFTQKLYLFEPINSVTYDDDGCIRTQEPIDFAKNYNLDMLSLANVAFVISGIPLRDPRLEPLDFGLRDDLKGLQCTPGSVSRRAFRTRGLAGRPLYIYRNRDVIPRVFAPARFETVSDDQAMYDALSSRSAGKLRDAALVRESELPPNVKAGSDMQVDVIGVETVRGDHLKITVRSDTGGLVIASASFSPYWHASAEGKALALFPAYHSLIGIWVPPGAHVVDLKYRPPYAQWLGYAENN